MLRAHVLRQSLQVLGLVLGCLSCVPVPPPPLRPPIIPRGDYSILRRHVDWRVDKAMRETRTRGFTVAVVDGDQTVLAKGFGDAAESSAADEHTPFRVGSISKLFTAIAVMQLVDQGRIALDQPLQEQLPQFSIQSRFDDAGPVTPRLMLTHHSGLPSDVLRGLISRDPFPYTEFATRMHDEFLAAPPGRVFSYSNVAYSILGHLVEHVSGEVFADYVRLHILQPLGMEDSSFAPDDAVAARSARGFRNGAEFDEGGISALPAGLLLTSAHDMGKFGAALVAMLRAEDAAPGHILRPAVLRDMMEQHNGHVARDSGFKIGLGFWTRNDPTVDRRVVFHGGDSITFHAMFQLVPQDGLAVFVACNTQEGAEATTAVAREVLGLAVETHSGKALPAPTRMPPPWLLESAASVEESTGTYGTILGVARVTALGNTLIMRLPGVEYQLVPDVAGGYLVGLPLLGVFPLLSPSVRMDIIEAEGDHVLVATPAYGAGFIYPLGTRFAPTDIPSGWRARQGAWHVTNDGQDTLQLTDVMLVDEDGLLELRANQPVMGAPTSYSIHPLSDDEAVMDGMGRQMGTTIRRVVAADGVDELVWSGLHFRR